MLLIFPFAGWTTSVRAQAAPQNTAAPTVSGQAVVGSTLTASAGTWTESPTFAYQWVRCAAAGSNPDGSDCTVIGGATTQAYVVSSTDVGFRMRIRVTGSNADGSATAASNATDVVAATLAPVRVTDPVVSGTARVGSTLTASQGTWNNSPTAFGYQWVRCPASGGDPLGSDCAVIGGASTASYAIASADLGARLRVRVTASNPAGSAIAASNPTAAIAAQASAPAKLTEPRIMGSPVVGSTLTATTGTWSGNPTSFAFQWVRCPASGGNPAGSDCPALGGQTGQAYKLVAADLGKRMRVRVTAGNATGKTTVASNATASVRPAAPIPAPTGCPAGTGAIRSDQLAAPARLLADRQTISPPVVGASTGNVTVRFRVSACGGRPVQGALVYVTAVPYNQFTVPAEQRTGADGWAQLTMRRLRGFPAARTQQLLVMFVRARKAGEPLLGGISTRRLVSFTVNLNR